MDSLSGKNDQRGHVDVVWRECFLARPALADDLNQFLADVDTPTILSQVCVHYASSPGFALTKRLASKSSFAETSSGIEAGSAKSTR